MTALNIVSNTDLADKDSWATPTEIVNGALAYFKTKGLIAKGKEYGLDVCASKRNAKFDTFITEKENALDIHWCVRLLPATQVAWCNPPYSRGMKEAFIEKAVKEVADGVETIMLLPNDTSAQWFSKCVKKAKAIAIICDGRISFVNNQTGEKTAGNNAGSILVLFGERTSKVASTYYVTKHRLEELGRG